MPPSLSVGQVGLKNRIGFERRKVSRVIVKGQTRMHRSAEVVIAATIARNRGDLAQVGAVSAIILPRSGLHDRALADRAFCRPAGLARADRHICTLGQCWAPGGQSTACVAYPQAAYAAVAAMVSSQT